MLNRVKTALMAHEIWEPNKNGMAKNGHISSAIKEEKITKTNVPNILDSAIGVLDRGINQYEVME